MDFDTRGKRGDWPGSRKEMSLNEQFKAVQLDHKLCLKQAKHIAEGTAESTTRRSFIQLFTAPKNALGVTIPPGTERRSTGPQANFRHNLICVSEVKHPGAGRSHWMWCPVTRTWRDEIVAANIFAYYHGQNQMRTIFGADGIGELSSAKNGILMSAMAAEAFDKGHFVIVPDLDDSSSQHDIDMWNTSDPKEYKIRLLNFDSTPVRYDLVLDGQRVEFKGNRRPRAKYLFFHYCVSMLRRSWIHDKHWELLKTGKGLWPIPGPYLRKSHILAFVEEIGHEVGDSLLQGCVDPESHVEEVDETALAAANDQIRITANDDRRDFAIDEYADDPWNILPNSTTTLIEDEDEDDDDDDGYYFHPAGRR
jgi:hypothetical protein